VTAEDDVRLKRAQLLSRRTHPQDRVDCQPIRLRGAVVRRGPERIGADQHAAVGPPERHLLQELLPLDGDAGERAERAVRDDVVPDALDE